MSWRPTPLSETPVEGTVVLPATFRIGVGEDGRGRWDWEVDLHYAKWSKFDSLDVESAQGSVVHQREDWDDTISFFGGFEYHFTDRHAGRGGVTVDPTPVPEDLTRPYNPDAGKAALTAGYGFRSAAGRFQVDAYAQLTVYEERRPESNLPEGVVAGVYDTRTWAAGVGFQYRF